MTMPTVGRRVWLIIRDGCPAPFARHGDQPHDAGIAFVWHEHLVNISVSDHNGYPQSLTSVHFRQPGEDEPVAPYWCEWMPYQIGQAKKDEAEAKRKQS